MSEVEFVAFKVMWNSVPLSEASAELICSCLNHYVSKAENHLGNWKRFWQRISLKGGGNRKMNSRKESIHCSPRYIKNKMEALNYCLLVCRESFKVLGCACDCELRKKWRIPPHGDRYYE